MKIASVQAKLLLLTACSASDNPHKFVRTRNTMSENMPREAAESFKSQSSSAGKQPFPLRVSSQQDVANEIADPALIINRESDDAFADKLYDSFQLIVITPPATNELGDQMADDDYSDDAAGVRFEWIPKDSAFNNAVITPSPFFSPTRTPTASPNTRAPSTAQPTTLQPSTLTPSLQPTDEPSQNPSPYPTIHPSSTPTINPSLMPSLNPSFSPVTKSPSTGPSISPITQSPSRVPTKSATSTSSGSPSGNPTSALPMLIQSRNPSVYPTTAAPVSAPSRTPSARPTSTSPTSTPSRSFSSFPTSALLASAPSRTPSGNPTSALPTPTLSDASAGYPTSLLPTSSQVEHSSTLLVLSDNFGSPLISNTVSLFYAPVKSSPLCLDSLKPILHQPTRTPPAEGGSVTLSPSPSTASYNEVPVTLDNTGSHVENLTSVDLPPMSISLNTTTPGELDTFQLNSLFANYLMEYLYLELPNRYQIHEIDIDTISMMDNGTKHEYLVTGTLEVVDRNDIDLTQLEKDVSSTLSALVSGQESSSVTPFHEVMQTADDETISSASEVTISLLEPLEEPSSVSAVVQEDEVVTMNDRTMYFIIAGAGFVGAIFLLGFAIYYSRSSNRKARKSRKRKRSAYQEPHRGRSRHHSPDSDRSHDSYDAAENNNPVVNFLIEACSSLMSGDSENKSLRSNGQCTVHTRDVENDCGWFCAPNPPKSTQVRSSSVPQRRPYPYPASDPVPAKSRVQKNTQPTDLTLTMKSTASPREEWTCVDGFVTKKVRSTLWD
ncbi:hypothetical protein ACHAW6_010702 [Cyclotella cf. meneghiniana]